MFLRPLFLSALAVLLASCGNDLDLVSKDRALSSGSSGWETYKKHAGIYPSADPSPRVVAGGAGKPTDKHGMPLYSGERLRHVRTTAYTCSEDDHLEYGSMNAAGTRLRYSDKVRSAAADWSVYPVGTVFRIKGLSHLYVIDDYGSALTGTGTIDLYKPSKPHMNAWGLRNVEISVVRWGSYERSAKLLSGRTGYSHCREMYTAIRRKLGDGMFTASR